MHLFVPLYVAVTKIAQLRSAPPAPVAPVTEGEVEAAIRAYRSECIAPPEDDACEDEAFGYLRSLIARRVAEARGHGLRELRARLLSTAGSLPNRQMGHSDEDFDRGYVEACENWAQEIDRLLAAPPASQLAEEPKWTPCPSSRDGWICIRRAGHTGAHESVHRTRWPNDACAVCKGTGQVEGTAGVVIGGKATMSMRLCPECSTSAIDRLRAKLAEEPAQEPKPSLSWRSIEPFVLRLVAAARVEGGNWMWNHLRKGDEAPTEGESQRCMDAVYAAVKALREQVESQARRIEALENNKEAGK